jgi:cell division protease FtsH
MITLSKKMIPTIVGNIKNTILTSLICIFFMLLQSQETYAEQNESLNNQGLITSEFIETSTSTSKEKISHNRSKKDYQFEHEVIRTPAKNDSLKFTQNNAFTEEKIVEQAFHRPQKEDYDPYALAEFFDVAQHKPDDGLLVGYDHNGIPLIVTEHDLTTSTDAQLINKIRQDPQFHEFREGFSLKRVQVPFPDFNLPRDVLKRNRLPGPGQITTALLVVDEKNQPVRKRNGEKALYFLRPITHMDLYAIQEKEEHSEDRDMDEALASARDKEKYDCRKMARSASDKYTYPNKGKSLVENTEGLKIDESKEENLRNKILSKMSYTQFWLLVRENRIDKVKLTDDRRSLWVVTKANAPGGPKLSKIGIPFDPLLPDHLLTHRVQVEDNEIGSGSKFLFNLARIILPIVIVVYVQKLLYNMGKPPKSSEDIFAQAKLEKRQGKKQVGVTFDDIAGANSVKDEMLEIIEFLRNPKKYIELGCRFPAGILLAGPPGTGKTLLARAVGGEAGVPFFSAAGTEFAEIFTGVGASRVRDMFEVARKNAPCILFIDEFDSIGKARQNSSTGGNDEDAATINQLLTELDGFEENEGILVIAATNRPSVLDGALTRPGRFDRIITMGLPNCEERESIYKVHARKNRVSNNIDWNILARSSASFSGAEIMNVMNLAATMTVQAQESIISHEKIFDAIEKVILEKANKKIVIREQDVDVDVIPSIMKRNAAVYIAAKGLLAYITPLFDEVIKISCCPSNLYNGRVFLVPREEQLELGIYSRTYLESSLVVLLAGHVAEKLIMGSSERTSLNEADLTSANLLARDMVFKFGLGRRVGGVSLVHEEIDYLRNEEQSDPLIGIDPFTASIGAIDVADLLAAAEAKAHYGIVANYRCVEALSSLIDRKPSLGQREIRQILEENGVLSLPSPFLDGFSFDPELSRFYNDPEFSENIVKDSINTM